MSESKTKSFVQIFKKKYIFSIDNFKIISVIDCKSHLKGEIFFTSGNTLLSLFFLLLFREKKSQIGMKREMENDQWKKI